MLAFPQNPNTASFPAAVATDTTLLVASNNGISTLSGSISNSQTTVPLTSAVNFIGPTAITIESEIILCVNLVGSVYNTCTRGWRGTTAVAHVAGIPVLKTRSTGAITSRRPRSRRSKRRSAPEFICSPSVGVNIQTGTSYTIANSDGCKIISAANASSQAYALPQAGSGGNFQNRWMTTIQNLGPGTLTVTPSVSTIDGVSSLTLASGAGAIIYSNGTNYFTFRGSGSGGGGGGGGGNPYSLCPSGCSTTIPSSGSTISAATHLQGINAFAYAIDSSNNMMFSPDFSVQNDLSGNLKITYVTTPAKIVIFGAVGGMANPMMAANQLIGSAGAAGGTPAAINLVDCVGGNKALNWAFSGNVFSCNTISATGFANPMTTLGDIIVGGSAGAAARLAGNTSTTPQLYTSTGSGGVATTPALQSLGALGIPTVGANNAFTGANAYGTPASIILTNAIGLPVGTGISGLGTGVAAFLASPSGSNLATALTSGLPLNGIANIATGTLLGNFSGGSGPPIAYSSPGPLTAISTLNGVLQTTIGAPTTGVAIQMLDTGTGNQARFGPAFQFGSNASGNTVWAFATSGTSGVAKIHNGTGSGGFDGVGATILGTGNNGQVNAFTFSAGLSGTAGLIQTTDSSGVANNIMDSTGINSKIAGTFGTTPGSASTVLTLNGLPKFTSSSSSSSTSTLFGSTNPASTTTAVAFWLQIVAPNGSVAYIPAWQ